MGVIYSIISYWFVTVAFKLTKRSTAGDSGHGSTSAAQGALVDTRLSLIKRWHPKISHQVSDGPADFDSDFHQQAMDLLLRAASMDDDPTINPYLLILIWSPNIRDDSGEPQLYCIMSRLLREAFYQQGTEPATFTQQLLRVVCGHRWQGHSVTSSGTATGMNKRRATHRLTAIAPSRTSTREPRRRFSEQATKIASTASALCSDPSLNPYLLLFILRPETKHRRNTKPKTEVSPLLCQAGAQQGVDIQSKLTFLEKVAREHKVPYSPEVC